MKEIIDQLLPNGFTMENIMNLITVLYAFGVSIYNTRIKKKIITSDIQASKSEAEAVEAKKQAAEAKNAIAMLADMILTVFLNSNTIDEREKQKLSVYATQIEKLAGVELDEEVIKLLDKIKEIDPDANILEKREQLIEAANKAEQVVDDANDIVRSLIDKLDV